jgi:hypothetical protein
MKRLVIVRALSATALGFCCVSVFIRIEYGLSIGLLLGIETDRGMAISAAIVFALLSTAVFLLAEKDHR